MENIKKSILTKNPEIKMKKYEFLELDYQEMFGELVPHYITQLKGLRIWKEDENSYSIQENSVFTRGMTEEEVATRINDNFAMMNRIAKLAEEEKVKKAKMLAFLKRKAQIEKVKAQKELPQTTLEFLTSLID